MTKMGPPLKYDLDAILAFLCRRYEETGWPVTIREVQQEFGISSSSVTNQYLHRLIDAGQVELNPTGSAGFRPTGYRVVRINK